MTLADVGSTIRFAVNAQICGGAQLDCNDDSVGGDCNGSTRARVFLNNIAAGTVLRIRLSGYNGPASTA